MGFLDPTPFEYPKFNTQIFEEFFYHYYTEKQNEINSNRCYLPIFWTSFYLRKNYGRDDLSELQNYIDSLDKSKKYFTLIQYDDGILNDVSGLDLYVFTLAQDKKYDFILPTTCMPRPNINKNRERNIFCSFFGRYKGEWSHPIQEKILETLPKNKYNTGKYIDYEAYCDQLERSRFLLCANGRSPTTFKICECLQSGTIPVFIYDKKWIPFEEEIDFEKCCVMIDENDVEKIDDILSGINKDKIDEMVKYGEYIYENYYEYNSLANKVIGIIKKF
jgi:hypothetical protein